MKIRINPTVRVSFGLLMLTLSLLFASDWLGFIPRQENLELEGRKLVSESLAVQFSSLAQASDTRHIRTTLEALVKRNPKIQSAAFRNIGSDNAIKVGNHDQLWTLPHNSEISTTDQVIVPIFENGKRWGSLEIRFNDFSANWYSRIMNNEMFKISFFICTFGLLAYILFMRRVLKELDPSQVIPERVKHAFDSIAEGVLILDEDSQIVLANRGFIQGGNFTQSDLLGRNASNLEWCTYQTDIDILEEKLPWSRVFSTNKPVTGERITVGKGSHDKRSYVVNCTPVIDDKDAVRGVIATFDDLTEIEKKNVKLERTLSDLKKTKAEVDLRNRELQFLASRDSLTGIMNRRAFMEHFDILFDKFREAGGDLTCIMADIDQFKRINDNYGHGVGDKVIRFVADVLSKRIRKNDLLGRYGGEEFCILLSGSSIEDARIVAEQMRAQVTSGDPNLFTSALQVTSSFGIASMKSAPRSKEELINMADRALYLAKESGRNKVVVWEDEADSISSNPGSLKPSEGDVSPPTLKLLCSAETTVSAEERIKELEAIAEKSAQQLDHYVAYDALTHLPERHLFLDRIEQAILSARREGKFLAVISLALPDLMRINDTLGHECAISLVTEVAGRLRDVLRKTDTVCEFIKADDDSTLSKLNEAEFGILVPTLNESESITWIIKRIFEKLSESVELEDHQLRINCNVGVGVYPHDGEDAITLVRRASVSRHYAEQQGGNNNVEYYSHEINQTARDQLLLESQMFQAIENHEFETLLQPKICIKTGEITGFEALLRWNHPTRGTVLPNDFIEIAEHTQMINLIGNWVLGESCKRVIELSELCGKNLSIAVNMSAVQFRQSDLVDQVLSKVEEYNLKPGMLELELTENCLVDNFDETFKALTALQCRGINISIDDFGTGYSGLSYLRSLPINTLKVDRCFISDIGESQHDSAITSAIISMAKALDLHVIAEGVETPTQLRLLAELGCDEAQGYLFSRPVSLDVAKQMVKEGLQCVIEKETQLSA